MAVMAGFLEDCCGAFAVGGRLSKDRLNPPGGRASMATAAGIPFRRGAGFGSLRHQTRASIEAGSLDLAADLTGWAGAGGNVENPAPGIQIVDLGRREFHDVMDWRGFGARWRGDDR